MRFRMLRGVSILAMLVGALGVGMTAHAAPAVNMAKLCSNGAYVLYMNDDGDQFASEAACVAWTRQHPGQPPIAIDNDPDGHSGQPVDTTDDSNDPSDSTPTAATDDSDDQSGDPSANATDDSDDQSTGKTALVIVTDPVDSGTATTDDDSDDGDG